MVAHPDDVITLGDDESKLLARLREGDESAFEQLVREHGSRMLATARRILASEEDAREAVQEAFLSAFRGLNRFAGGSRLGTWLHRIAINAALMRLRSLKRRHETPIDDLLPPYTAAGHFAEPPEAWAEAASESLLREESKEVVLRKIGELPDPYRIALLLRDIEGLSNQELAEALGVSVNAAKIRVHRARQALKTLLDPYVTGAQA